MLTVERLAAAAREALAVAREARDLLDAEVYVSARSTTLARLSYASHIPSNGVEEPKSSDASGIGIRAVFARDGGRAVGFGSEPSGLDARAARRVLDKARAAAVVDPEFVSLPLLGPDAAGLGDHHDPALLDLSDDALVTAGWTVLGGALRAFRASSRLARLAESEDALRRLGLIVGGDVTVDAERVATTSTRTRDAMGRADAPGGRADAPVFTDQTTRITSFVTAMIEAANAKGSGWSAGTRLDDLTDEAGVEAAERAIRAIGGERVPEGRYTVIFGRQPIADLMNTVIAPSLSAMSFYTSSTPFLGRLGQRIASPVLTVVDDGARPGFVASRRITGEGLPTGRTVLIREGVLSGCLSSWYQTERLLRDADLLRKLGASGEAARAALVPRNGFRGGRGFDERPGVAASNLLIESRETMPFETLVRTVNDGLYIGRIWYSYPINGLRAGDFTSTVVGDSYIIRDGRLAAPIRANVIRIDDNIRTVLEGVIGVSDDTRATIVWAADEVVYTPDIAVAGVRVNEIRHGTSARTAPTTA
jgi:PmbA protein